MALSGCDGGGKPRRAGSLKEAVRSSSLMGGLCKRTDSKKLGWAQAQGHMMVRAHHIGIHLSLPIVSFFIVGRDNFNSPHHQLLYELPVFCFIDQNKTYWTLGVNRKPIISGRNKEGILYNLVIRTKGELRIIRRIWQMLSITKRSLHHLASLSYARLQEERLPLWSLHGHHSNIHPEVCIALFLRGTSGSVVIRKWAYYIIPLMICTFQKLDNSVGYHY